MEYTWTSPPQVPCPLFVLSKIEGVWILFERVGPGRSAPCPAPYVPCPKHVCIEANWTTTRNELSKENQFRFFCDLFNYWDQGTHPSYKALLEEQLHIMCSIGEAQGWCKSQINNNRSMTITIGCCVLNANTWVTVEIPLSVFAPNRLVFLRKG